MSCAIRALAICACVAVLASRASAEATTDAVREAQMPSPGGGGKPLAQLVNQDDFTLALRGFGQFYASPYAGAGSLVAEGDPIEHAGMRARRLQLGIEGTAAKQFSYSLWMDLAESPILLEAWLAWNPAQEFGIQAGVVRVPFSRSALQSSAELTFSERALSVSNLVPERQPGIAVYGGFAGGMVTYRAGWFNGAEKDRAALGPDHNAGLFAGRVAFAPLGAVRPGQSDLERGPLRLELAVNAMQNYAAGYTGTSFGADLLVQGYGASLLVEYIHDTKVPLAQPEFAPTLPDTTTRTGAIAQASYQVWGPMEVAARIERFDDNTALNDVGDVLDSVFGVHANFTHVKVGLDYYHRAELAGLAIDNDAVIGSFQGRF